ncbi:hypothetical protein [Klebsiella phage phiKp_21]|nr:hypothetical protein [Klebsiella phage phiKp_21]
MSDRITRKMVADKVAGLNLAIDRRGLPEKYQVVLEDGKFNIELQPSHVYTKPTAVQKYLSTREAYFYLKGMFEILLNNVPYKD